MASTFVRIQWGIVHTPALDDLYQTSRHVSGLPFESPIPTTDYFPHLSVWYENASREVWYKSSKAGV